MLSNLAAGVGAWVVWMVVENLPNPSCWPFGSSPDICTLSTNKKVSMVIFLDYLSLTWTGHFTRHPRGKIRTCRTGITCHYILGPHLVPNLLIMIGYQEKNMTLNFKVRRNNFKTKNKKNRSKCYHINRQKKRDKNLTTLTGSALGTWLRTRAW